MESIIHITELSKRYKGSREEALKGVDLDILKGEFFGLLGPNAAGKSTLLSILCGILSPSSGKVNLFGEELNSKKGLLSGSNRIKRKNRMGTIHREIGLIPQEIALYPTLTVEENIRFFGSLHGIASRELRKKTDSYIQLFNLDEHRHKPISKCSGGIKRRINLIAGVIHQPELILLDEPTLGVDPQLRSMIFDFLTALNREGTTLIYTTHYMKEAEILCNRVGIIDHGSILKKGKPEELIASDPESRDLGDLFLKLTGRDLRD